MILFFPTHLCINVSQTHPFNEQKNLDIHLAKLPGPEKHFHIGPSYMKIWVLLMKGLVGFLLTEKKKYKKVELERIAMQ